MTVIDTAMYRRLVAQGAYGQTNWPGDVHPMLAMCDALDAARAELKACHGNPVAGNPGEWPHVDQIEGLSTQAAKWYRAQPVVEAAVALDAEMWPTMTPKFTPEILVASNRLKQTVAAYEARQEKPSVPVVPSGLVPEGEMWLVDRERFPKDGSVVIVKDVGTGSQPSPVVPPLDTKAEGTPLGAAGDTAAHCQEWCDPCEYCEGQLNAPALTAAQANALIRKIDGVFVDDLDGYFAAEAALRRIADGAGDERSAMHTAVDRDKARAAATQEDA